MSLYADVADAVERDMDRLPDRRAADRPHPGGDAAQRRGTGVPLRGRRAGVRRDLGAAVLVVQVLGGRTGVTFTLPLVLFLFVTALGTDQTS
ncbi:MAG TPA: hypothetical protein VF533_21980 [Solirubrobacteraceae bacterium]